MGMYICASLLGALLAWCVFVLGDWLDSLQ